MNVPIPSGLQPRPDPRAPRLDELVAAVDRVLELPDPAFGAHGVGDEILVLQRQIDRPRFTDTDRTILAVLSTVFARSRLGQGHCCVDLDRPARD